MVPKWFMWFWIVVGSLAGGLVPMLWGADAVSFSSILGSGIGAFLGILIAIKIANKI